MPDHPLKPLLIGGMGVGVIRRKSVGGVPYGGGGERSFFIEVINLLKENSLWYKSLTYKDLKSYPQGIDTYGYFPYLCRLIIHPKGQNNDNS